MAPDTPFAIELAVFDRHRDEWYRSHPGRFVAIQDSAIAGFFDSYGDALKAGLQKFGVQRGFLVKQVWTTEPIYLVS